MTCCFALFSVFSLAYVVNVQKSEPHFKQEQTLSKQKQTLQILGAVLESTRKLKKKQMWHENQ